MYPHISEINPAAKFYGKITGQSTLQIPCSWEYCFCWSHSTVTKALWTSECTQVSPVLSIVTKGHFSWDAFLIVWKCLLCWRCFYRCMINKFGHAVPHTWNIFTNGARLQSKSAYFCFCACITHPKVALVSSGSKALATLWKNQKSWVCCCFHECPIDFYDFQEWIQ